MGQSDSSGHGSNVVTSADEIMIQETTPGYDVTQHEISLLLYDRSKVGILKVDTPKSLPPLYIYTRVGREFSLEPSFTPASESDEQWIGEMQEHYVWLLVKNVGSHGQQRVQVTGGFISITGKFQQRRVV